MQKVANKKRKKQIRQAITMRRRLNRDLTIIVCSAILGVTVVFAYMIVCLVDIDLSKSSLIQIIPFTATVFAIGFAGIRASAWSANRSRYKTYLEENDISEEDMRSI